MPNTKTIHVPHLWGIDAAYQMLYPYDASKPTVVLINAFATSSEIYRAQFADKSLTDNMNLLAIEPLGHGQTRTKCPTWTYWDSAIMALQVLEKLGIQKAFGMGTSQGGWIVVQMALLAPEVIEGIIPLGTSMDYESSRSRETGCWDGRIAADGLVSVCDVPSPTPDFELGDDWGNLLVNTGMRPDCDPELREFWVKESKANYAGNDGRERLRMCAIGLRDRDGLHTRLRDVKCPVLRMHGASDSVFSIKNAEYEMKLFTASPSAELVVVEGGQHFLSISSPKEVGEALIRFVGKRHGNTTS